jgi:hypothetical protein
VISYAQTGWWTAFTVMPQLAADKPENEDGEPLVLDEHERINARLIFGLHL